MNTRAASSRVDCCRFATRCCTFPATTYLWLALLLLVAPFPIFSPSRLLAASAPAPAAARVLLVTGIDYPGHKWRETTPVLVRALTNDARLRVDVVDDPYRLDQIDLSPYRAVFLHFMNWEQPDPNEKARENLRRFVDAGGGLVMIHFACGAFRDWPEFRNLAGRVYDRTNTHDPRGPFTVNITNPNHPITAGLASFAADDELYICLAGEKPVNVLAAARSKITKRDHPMAFVHRYGRGRVFQTPLGHDVKALRTGATLDLIRRGTLWAAGADGVAGVAVEQANIENIRNSNRSEKIGTIEAAAGDLLLKLRTNAAGIEVAGLIDRSIDQPLLATNPLPLFAVTLRRANTTNTELRVAADNGWSRVSAQQTGRELNLEWRDPTNRELAGISVRATADLDAPSSAIRWQFRVRNDTRDWSAWRIVFPQLALANPGTGSNSVVFFPRGPGEVQRGIWDRPFRYRGDYPGGWCSMQFLAAYREGEGEKGNGKATGLYAGLHDPFGSTKYIEVQSDVPAHRVRMAFDIPAPDMGRPGNQFSLEGEAVWQLLRGDWFDAATIYKSWAQRHARWWPALSAEGRADTPSWMRELSAWAQAGGGPRDCVSNVMRFQEFLGVPVGFHWYSWHQIPFDNDYPHYLPPKAGFANGVRDLKAARVFPMPYINGRLWDSKDRGADDFEFTRLALAASTKQPDGKPFLESYGSKETNGEPVRLAAMCPATPLWQQTVSNVVLRLLGEIGTSAVYIDQVAAAAPTLCADPAHGHPLGGGHWWNEGYWTMLDAIRRARPPETMLTTECNGEPFIRWFDGYLTWHWQHDGQVPAFPTVYGGAIQMFGRAYRGGATRDLALRMKAGQELVFGEQIGWMGPEVIKDKDAGFLREAVRVRHEFRRFFSAGEMARPPKFFTGVPKVKADWQWSGEWWVTTDAVLTGAWKLKKQLLLLFANVSDQPVTATLRFEPRAYGVEAAKLRCRVVGGGDSPHPPSEAHDVSQKFERQLTFKPRHVEAWELSW